MWGYSSMVENMPSMCGALSSITASKSYIMCIYYLCHMCVCVKYVYHIYVPLGAAAPIVEKHVFHRE